MKALTLWEPWASLMAYQYKRIETRCWATKYRGNVAIHAAKSRPKHLGISCERPEFIAEVNRLLPRHQFALGCIVAIGRLVDIKPTTEVEDLGARERLFGNYDAGRYAWYFDDVMTLEHPIAVSGNRLLWEWNVSDQDLAAIDFRLAVSA